MALKSYMAPSAPFFFPNGMITKACGRISGRITAEVVSEATSLARVLTSGVVFVGSCTVEGGTLGLGESTVPGSCVVACGSCWGEVGVGVGCITISSLFPSLRRIRALALHVVGLWQAFQ